MQTTGSFSVPEQVSMDGSLRWTAWNLTATGWLRGQTVESAGDVSPDRPLGTLLALVSVYDEQDPERIQQVSVLFRHEDTDAVANAIGSFGPKPPD
jgi:hypothetical protein